MKPIPAIEVKPSQGGKLMSGFSAEAPGLQNYLIKRDWRRFYDKEIRAEGHEGLVLNQSVTPGIQITPTGSSGPLSLICQARRGDGMRVIVAGNQTTLWAYTGTQDTHYAINATGGYDYFANDAGVYVDETQYGWIQIASGLSTSGRRWEAESCGDYIVLNNGVDLPLTYRPGESTAKPIYELREQQIASVGTIAVHNGILLAMDLWIINDTDFENLMAPTVVNSDGTFTPNPVQYSAFTKTSAMQRFPWRVLPSMQGQPRRFGAIVPVQANLNSYTLSFQYPVRSIPELVAYNNAGGYLTGVLGGSTDVQVLYAGLGGSTLNTSIVACDPTIAMSVTISDKVQSPVNFTVSDYTSQLEASDAADSYAGTYIDLVDTGSAILKAKQLLNNIIIFKETPEIYIGQFTGDLTNPYQFTRVVLSNQGQAIKYRNTLISSGGGGFYGSCLIYAGERAFYKFDMFNQAAVEVPELQSCQDLFFQAAAANPENAFAAENSLTREWYFCWQPTKLFPDRALCLDYAYRTCRTTTADVCAANRIEDPRSNASPGVSNAPWLFVFGDSLGSVQRYGLWDAPTENPVGVTIAIASNVATASTAYFTAAHVGKTLVLSTGDIVAVTSYLSPTMVGVNGSASVSGATFTVLPAIWHRNGAGYDSVLETGAGDLGVSDNEKLVNRYVVVASSGSPNSLLNVSFKAGINPSIVSFVQTATVPSPDWHNMIQPTFMGYYVGVNLDLSGINNPFELVNQIWQAIPIGTKSASRL